ncbi:MAG: hypothetical protein EBS89_13215, partial [Proteobacteria bacterium]|nr:hypothetical protein [Pseudomonadota bacterium]
NCICSRLDFCRIDTVCALQLFESDSKTSLSSLEHHEVAKKTLNSGWKIDWLSLWYARFVDGTDSWDILCSFLPLSEDVVPIRGDEWRLNELHALDESFYLQPCPYVKHRKPSFIAAYFSADDLSDRHNWVLTLSSA